MIKNQIVAMNRMYGLPVNEEPTLFKGGLLRILNFKRILEEEIKEADDIIDGVHLDTPDLEVLTHLADWLADIVIYCHSEALKYGIPLEEVIAIVMESNMSKLGEDGMPMYDERGKVLKGPNYWRPEAQIAALLSTKCTK